MAKCLVTGGAGFIGSHVAEDLLKAGHTVTVLDDLSGGFEDNVPAGAKFVKGSVTDAALVNGLFAEGKFEHVFHLAAYAAEGLSHFIRKFNYENNLIGSVNLVNASVNNGVKCFVFTSSIAVYGAGQLPLTEDMAPMPEDPYGASKLAVEHDLHAAQKMFGLDFVVFRPHNVYGERQNIGDRYRNVAGIFMNQILLGQPMSIFGDGEQTRAFTYIKDVSPIIADSAFRPEAYNQVFNIGSEQPFTVNELAERVREAMGAPAHPIKHLEARNEVVHAFSSHDRLKKVFGYTPKYGLAEGVQAMADWAKKAGSRASTEFGNIEIERNLPPSWRKKA
ncbi:MAG TPA: UDP-glucose 4-epimerase [Elusimicrobia bacterium]|nr:MAG: UDP-glucose 4-epimerase [Elusimicrobia bacterium GWD2_63_28]HCC48843.1 UDP-glucose 4-epimerase [Elusimicrobiota bacterium]